MNNKIRCLLVLAVLLAASLACNLPVRLKTPEPSVPTPKGQAELPPSATPAAGNTATSSITAIPPSDTPLPTATLLPSETTTATLAPSATSTSTATVTPTRTRPAASPTAPPTLTAQPSLTRTVSPTRTRTARPEPSSRVIYTATYFSEPPVLDGVWDEWRDSTDEYPARNVVFGGENWTGSDDLDMSFRVGWDENYLYLAAKVRDDVYVQNASEANLYLGDSLEVLFDRNLSGDLSSHSLSGDDYQLGISPGSPDVDGAKEAYLWFPRSGAGPRAKVKIAAVRQEGVTRIEAAVPWSVFGTQPESGNRYGFALSASDNDDPNADVQESMISSAAHRVLVDPTTWGELRLQ